MTDHLSPSQILMFMRCQAQWKFRYIDGLKIPPSSAMVQGTSFHKTQEHNFKLKIESHEDRPTDELKEFYAAEADRNFKGEILWTPEEEASGIDKIRGGLLDEGIKLVDCAAREINPSIQPKAVEQTCDVHISAEIPVYRTVIDLFDDKETIHEFKTTARTPSSIDSSHFFQGASYYLATGSPDISFDYLVKTKVPKSKIITYTFSESDRDFVVAMIRGVDRAIRTGIFLPNRNNFLCSKSYCGFFRFCTKEFGGSVKD